MKKNKLWIPITACVLALAVIVGAFLLPRLPKAEAAVFPVTMVGYTDFYSGSTESYGMVTTDKVQTLYLSGTQTVTEILVYPGQEVKKGDVLFTYDTTLSDLAVERKDLANQQLEVQLKTAQAELADLKKMKPIVYKPGSNTSTTKTDYAKSPANKDDLNTVYSTKTTGKSSSSPLYVWLENNKQVDDAFIDDLYNKMISLHRLDNAGTADTEDMGPLPRVAVLLIGGLAAVWALMLGYVFLTRMKHRKIANSKQND